MPRALVTGAAGVIGTQLVHVLVSQGIEVFAADLKPRPKSFPQAVVYRQGDLNNLQLDELAGYAPDLIFHLAASFERTTETYGFFEDNFRNNVQLSHHMLDLAKRLESRTRFVFASSYLIYDSALSSLSTISEPVPLFEGMPERPRNLTGMAKYATESELRFLSQFQESNMNAVSARIFRGYGLGSRDVVSRWIRSLLRREAIEVYDQSSSFDFIYCKDTAHALANIGVESNITGVLNIGTGKSTPIAEIYEQLRLRFPDGQYVEREDAESVERSVANLDYLSSITGWTPQYTVETAIDEIFEFESRLIGDVWS